jgi:hypothetical protein
MVATVLRSATSTYIMEPGIVKHVFAILYGCPQDTTEEDLLTLMRHRYSVAAGLVKEGACLEAVVDAIEGFDWSTSIKEKEDGRARRDAAAQSFCRLQSYGYLEVKILAEKYAGEMGIHWASQFTDASAAGQPVWPPLTTTSR